MQRSRRAKVERDGRSVRGTWLVWCGQVAGGNNEPRAAQPLWAYRRCLGMVALHLTGGPRMAKPWLCGAIRCPVQVVSLDSRGVEQQT